MKKLDENLTRRKLISNLVNEPSDGEIQALLATTYDLNADFFETDFLPSLLDPKTWNDRNWVSRIAMEKKLALMESATVFAEATRYLGRPRSLRVELVPVKLSGRRLHAKVVLAVNERSVKFLVSSANLTKPGYRQNREVAVLLTASENSPEAASLIRPALEELPSILGVWWTESAQRALDVALTKLSEWQAPTSDGQEWFFWGGGRVPLWECFIRNWPEAEPIKRISIVSPFWAEQPDHGFLDLLLGTLKERRQLSDSAELCLFTEAAQANEGGYRPVLPPAYCAFPFADFGVRATAVAVDPCVLKEEGDFLDGFTGIRSLHAKVFLVEGPQTSLAYMGSANFTRHGWGFGIAAHAANIEAGLIIRRSVSQRSQLYPLIPATIGTPVLLADHTITELMAPESSAEECHWPAWLHTITLSPGTPDQLDLLIKVIPGCIEGAWTVSTISHDGASEKTTSIYEHKPDSTVQEEIRASLTPDVLNQILRDQEVAVTWWGSSSAVTFPVNVELAAREALPVAPDNAKLQEQHILAYYQGRISWEDLFPDPGDPESANKLARDSAVRSCVDTSGIQSYQIREFVEALKGISDDLRQECYSAPSMRLALFGPVSPLSLAKTIVDAVRAKTRTPVAAGFQMVEILVCLDQASEFDVEKKLANDWRSNLSKAVTEIELLLKRLQEDNPTQFHNAAFARYQRVVRQKLEASLS